MLAKRSFGDLSTQKEETEASESQERPTLRFSKRKELKIEKLASSGKEAYFSGENRLGKMASFGNVSLENIERHLFMNRCKKEALFYLFLFFVKIA